MPEMKDRGDYEAMLATGLSEIFGETRAQYDRGERIAWDEFTAKVDAKIDQNLSAVFVLMFMGLADKGLQNGTALADSLGRQWSSTTSRGIANALSENMRAELAAGGDAAKVFSGGRAVVVSTTEITRAITQAEVEARRQNAATLATTGAVLAVGLTMFDVGDGLKAVWITERDERVCPICSPLHSTFAGQWTNSFPEGPPAHPNCRCYLEYR